jgi:hypothetical protein
MSQTKSQSGSSLLYSTSYDTASGKKIGWNTVRDGGWRKDQLQLVVEDRLLPDLGSAKLATEN